MILDGIFQKRASLENPSTSLSDPDNWLRYAMGAMPTTSNVDVSERTATTITAFWSAVNTISDTLGLLPIRLLQKDVNGKITEIRDHTAYQRLKLSPNPAMTATVFKSTMQSHVLTWGNGYSMVTRNTLGHIKELWPLEPGQTKPVFRNRVLSYETIMNGEQITLPADDVLHVPALSRDGFVGMSIVREQREMLGSAIAINQFGSRFFANSARPGGLLSFPGKIRDLDALKKDIQTKYTGTNAHSLMAVDGDATFTPFAVPPDDAQFLQSKEFSVDEIGRMFRLPLHFLNKMGQATFNNLEMMGSHFVQYTMMPWFTRWEQELTRKLLTEAEILSGMYFKVNSSAIVRGDIKTRNELYAKAITNGWMTRNEVRALEDLNPLDGLDEPLTPMNMSEGGDDTDDEPEDEPTDDGTDDEQAGRLLTKEQLVVEKLYRKHSDRSELAKALDVFYRSHRDELVTWARWDGNRAFAYTVDHGQVILDATTVVELISAMSNWSIDDESENP